MKGLQGVVLAATILVTGCTTTQGDGHPDPMEPLNRDIYSFNQTVDKYLIKPIAVGYRAAVPNPIQAGVGNFFDNLREISTVANDILQLKLGYAVHDATRFIINSTIGIFGIFDPAYHLGLERRQEDFGQTLYAWGFKDSSYLVLPLLGPSTVRDAIGSIVDFGLFSIWPHLDDELTYSLRALDLVDTRAAHFSDEKVMDAVAVDEYSFVRDAYFQHRRFLRYDGQPPLDDIDDSFFEDDEPLDEELDAS